MGKISYSWFAVYGYFAARDALISEACIGNQGGFGMWMNLRSFPVVSLHLASATIVVLSGCGTAPTATNGQVTSPSTIDLPPIADAGLPLEAIPGDTVVLDGSASYDPDGDPVRAKWSQIAGELVSLSDADTVTARFVAPELDQSAVLMFLLEVSDGLSTSEDKVAIRVPAVDDTISVAELAPDLACEFSVLLDEDYDQLGGQRPLQVTLQGTIIGGGIPDDAILTWTIDGTEEAGPVDTHAMRTRIFTAAGLHAIALTLTASGSSTGCLSAHNGRIQETVGVWPVVVGWVQTADGVGVPAVTVSADGGGTTSVTDGQGRFEIHVPNGWSGAITAQHVGYQFETSTQVFRNITNDKTIDVFFLLSDVNRPDLINDLCPNDPNKMEPGQCGCDLPDTDTDADGIADCKDNCPTDRTKTAPGVCGCGVPDGDSDGDGTPDCNDGCPSDPQKTASGACGCGVADTDSDGNGTPDCLEPTAPSMVLDIPEPTAIRMSPCPVFASLDFDASSTGDGSTWDQCRITWTLSRVGGLAPWPAKYRYVTDPRPGLGGVQRDLAVAGRGFNMAWLLTEGDWTIQCTVTNPSRRTASVSSVTITIEPNTRTKVFVNSAIGTDDVNHGASAGAPYATLGYAFSRHGSTDDMEYELAGGHVELRTVEAMKATGHNAYITWDGSGSRPTFTWGVDAGGFDTMITVATGSEHQVWEGVQVENTSSANAPAGTRVSAFTVGGDLCAFFDVYGAGALAGNTFDKFIMPGGPGPTGVLIQNCVTDATSAYSLVYTSFRDYYHTNVIGCDFGPSSNESVIRTTAPVHKFNCLYCNLTQNTSKSCIRMVNGTFMHAYGNKLTDGEAWLGRVNTPAFVTTLRFEANHMSGTTSVGGLFQIRDALHDATICNNILQPDSQIPMSFGGNPLSGANQGLRDIKFLSNTVLVPPGNTRGLFSGGGDSTNVNFSDNEIRGNLCIIPDPGQRTDGSLFYDISDVAMSVITDNVITPFGMTAQDHFARVYVNGSITHPHDLPTWNALSFVGDDIEADTAVDAAFVPTPATNVNTPPGILDDYYGDERGVTSWAGAVGTAP